MKKLLSLFISACFCLALLAGCGGSSAPDNYAPQDSTGEEVYYILSVEAFYHDEDMRIFYISETWDEETTQSEYNNLSFPAVAGDTLTSLMEGLSYSDFELVDANGTFLGWMKYEIHEDDEGFTTWVRADDVLYTTEEIMTIPVEDISLSFVAKWSDIPDTYYTENGY